MDEKKVEWGDAWRQLDDAQRRVHELETALKKANAANSRILQVLHEMRTKGKADVR